MLKRIARFILRDELRQWTEYADYLEQEIKRLRSQSAIEVTTQLAILEYIKEFENVE